MLQEHLDIAFELAKNHTQVSTNPLETSYNCDLLGDIVAENLGRIVTAETDLSIIFDLDFDNPNRREPQKRTARQYVSGKFHGFTTLADIGSLHAQGVKDEVGIVVGDSFNDRIFEFIPVSKTSKVIDVIEKIDSRDDAVESRQAIDSIVMSAEEAHYRLFELTKEIDFIPKDELCLVSAFSAYIQHNILPVHLASSVTAPSFRVKIEGWDSIHSYPYFPLQMPSMRRELEVDHRAKIYYQLKPTLCFVNERLDDNVAEVIELNPVEQHYRRGGFEGYEHPISSRYRRSF